MKIRYSFLGFMLCVGIWGCETEYTDQLLPPYPGDQLVLNVLLNPETPVKAFLTHTLPPLLVVDTLPVVAGANVKLFEDGTLVGEMTETGAGIYAFSDTFRVKPDRSYYMEAKAAGYPSVRSFPEKIPDTLSIVSANFQDSTIACVSCYAPEGELQIAWKANQTHYIRFEFHGKKKNSWETIDAEIVQIGVPENLSECGNNPELGIPCTKGDIFFLRSRIRGYYLETGQVISYEDFRVKVQFLSSSYYQYLITQNQAVGIEAVFLYAQEVYSNIEGGYGLVAGVNEIFVEI